MSLLANSVDLDEMSHNALGQHCLPKYSFKYCKFGHFSENFIFANSVKRHICDIKNSRLRHDLPPSINLNDRVISPFHEGLFSQNFAYAKFHEIKTIVKISKFTVNNGLKTCSTTFYEIIINKGDYFSANSTYRTLYNR